MLETLRRSYLLAGEGQPLRWIGLASLAVVASIFEVAGAALIFLLLRLVTNPTAPLNLPLVGDIRGSSPVEGNDKVLALTLAALGAFFLMRAALLIIKTYCEQRIVNNAGARLASRLATGYLSMPYAFHLSRSSAELIRNAYYTVATVVNQVLTPAVSLLADMLMVFGLLTVLLVTSPLATGLAIGVMGPLVWILLRVVHPRLKLYGAVSQTEASVSLASLQESLEGVRDIRLLGREQYFGQVFAATRRRFSRAQYLRGTAFQVPRTMIETGLILFVLALFGLSTATSSPQEAVPVIGLFAYAGFRLQPSLQRIVASLNSIRFASSAVDDLYDDVLLLDVGHVSEMSRGSLPRFQHSLRLDNVSFSYDASHPPVLKGINLAIAHGESIGICGPTGGGKSTLVDVLAGLLQPTAGRVLVDDVDIRDNLPAWYEQLGVVSQSIFLIDETMRRNIAFGDEDCAIDDDRVQEAIEMAQLADVVAALPYGLETRLGERGIRLSGGQRQRVAIARALYRNPRVLIFDEGTSALDTDTEQELVGAIERLRGSRTIITVAHRLSTVERCDRLLFVEAGCITAVGTFEELALRHGAFQRMTGRS